MNTEPESSGTPETPRSFAEKADLPPVGFWREFAEFLVHNKKWWLIPLLLVLALLTLVVFLSGSPLAPFIYPIF